MTTNILIAFAPLFFMVGLSLYKFLKGFPFGGLIVIFILLWAGSSFIPELASDFQLGMQQAVTTAITDFLSKAIDIQQ